MVTEGDEAPPEATDDGDAEGMPPMDFGIFLLSLNTSALVQLGDRPDTGGDSGIDLPMARQTIDIVAMLETKTRGNLTGSEERLIGQVLFDLRMRYSDKAKKHRP